MTLFRRLTPLHHWLLGRDPKVRRHAQYTVGAGALYLINLALMAHATSFGVVESQVAWLLLACMLASFAVFFTLVRSGWSQRWADPVLTLPHAMVSMVITVLAYVLVGHYRGDVIVLLAQALVLAMFRLRPRQNLFLGAWGTGWLSLAQLALVQWGAPDFTPERALAHFILSASALMAMSVVAMWISSMRERMSRQSRELRRTLVQAQALATTDMLTGLVNRRSITEQLEAELNRADRSTRPACVALIDIDHFKRINDHHGHRAGDEVLRTFAHLAQTGLRQVDRLARWGGEEFLLLMPCVDESQAWVALERLRTRVSGHPMGERGAFTVTVSAGLAQYRPGESLDEWVERADKALYAAKRAGRDRCHRAVLATTT